jgi:hypothetical protein
VILHPKRLALALLFSRWGRRCAFEDGYTLVLPSPMDMPFLLRYALEGLAHLNTENCRQILVVPDGFAADRGDALDRVIREFDDPRVALIRPRPLDTFLCKRLKTAGAATTHWMMAVQGIEHARCGHAFLHDADAFFLAAEGLERQYGECRDRGMWALGVTARWDPFFTEAGYAIPGTWELMFSTRWARSRSPLALKNGWYATPRGDFEFDSMHHPMYLDAPSGLIGVMEPPPPLVHFNGTIVSYRFWRMGQGKVDETFRLLLLAVLEDLIPSAGPRVVPTVPDLVRGLTDPDQPVTYNSEVAIRQYPTFRRQLDQLCEAPIFAGARAERIHELVRPFDAHFEPLIQAWRASWKTAAAPEPAVRVRTHGMGFGRD